MTASLPQHSLYATTLHSITASCDRVRPPFISVQLSSCFELAFELLIDDIAAYMKRHRLDEEYARLETDKLREALAQRCAITVNDGLLNLAWAKHAVSITRWARGEDEPRISVYPTESFLAQAKRERRARRSTK